jgi:DNA-binding phage protein
MEQIKKTKFMEEKINKEDMKLQFSRLSAYVEQVMKQNGVLQSKIAERTGLTQPVVSRFFSGKYAPRLTTFLQVISALGIKISLKDSSGKTPGITL